VKRIFKNAKLVLHDRIMNGCVVTQGNLIAGIYADAPDETDAVVVDCKGLYLSPGFVDLHIHGGAGADFMDGSEESVRKILAAHGKYGTTSMLPTTLTGSRETVIRALKTIETSEKNWKGGPRILGAHLEGNFFSMEQKGAQNPAYIIPPTEENYRPILDSVSNIKRVSCAPEVENALNFASELSGRGILVSAAHTVAGYEEFLAGVNHGFSHVTHIYNGMSHVHSPNYYCKAGVSESALLFDEVCVEVIADGRHVPRELLKLLYKVKGPERMHLCTDAICATDMPPEGEYMLGGLDVVVKDQVAVLKTGGSFAGSVCTTDRLVRTMVQIAGVPLHDAVRMMTATPAKQIGEYHRLGSIQPGKLADLNVFDDEIHVKYTLIDGEVYQNHL
jgi:N-acetylglucosamine-6-phosphate deacetylase